jgi:probable phosphoglycerate mutase
MKFFIVRHGQTEWNLAGKRQGRKNSPLTELGKKQAKENAEKLVGQNIAEIFSSPIERAFQTAIIIGDKLNIKPKKLDSLSEFDVGCWSGLTNKEIKETFPGQIQARKKDKLNYRIPKGESYMDVRLRSKKALDIIKNITDKNILIVSHEMIGRTIIANLVDMANDKMLRILQPNSVIYAIENNDVSYIDEKGDYHEGLLLESIS